MVQNKQRDVGVMILPRSLSLLYLLIFHKNVPRKYNAGDLKNYYIFNV